jgi:oxygen-dependent protoporphyrinogen oxidase
VGLGVDVLLVEASGRVGGKIETINRDGYQFEAGPNTLIANRTGMLDLLSEAGLEEQIVEALPTARRRWVAMGDGLCPLPRGPVAALTSPLLGLLGLGRTMGDLGMRRPPDTPADESVASFVKRRFGRRVLANLVSPFLSGIYAGDAEKLEARAVLKAMVEAEERYGSVIRGMMAARRANKGTGTPKLPMRSITLREGLEALPRRILELLGERVLLGAAVRSLEQDARRCMVMLACGERIACDRVVIATNPHAAADLVAPLRGGAEVAAGLRGVRCAGLSTVGLGFDRAAVPDPLDGFGYLAGPGAKGPVLGCLFRSSFFPQAAPPGKALLVAFVGGIKHPGWAEKEESELVAAARAELRLRLGVTAEPERVFVRRWAAAVPQYERGHTRMRATAERWGREARVSMVGSALTGLSLNDCVCAGRAEAERIAALENAAGRAGRKEDVLCPSA